METRETRRINLYAGTEDEYADRSTAIAEDFNPTNESSSLAVVQHLDLPKNVKKELSDGLAHNRWVSPEMFLSFPYHTFQHLQNTIYINIISVRAYWVFQAFSNKFLKYDFYRLCDIRTVYHYISYNERIGKPLDLPIETIEQFAEKNFKVGDRI